MIWLSGPHAGFYQKQLTAGNLKDHLPHLQNFPVEASCHIPHRRCHRIGSFSGVAVANDHRLGSLKQQRFLLRQFWRPGGWNQALCSPQRILSCLFGLVVVASFLGLWLPHPSLCLSPHRAFPRPDLLPLSFPLRTLVLDWGPALIQDHLISRSLNAITSAKIVFPIRSHSEVPGIWFWIFPEAIFQPTP